MHKKCLFLPCLRSANVLLARKERIVKKLDDCNLVLRK